MHNVTALNHPLRYPPPPNTHTPHTQCLESTPFVGWKTRCIIKQSVWYRYTTMLYSLGRVPPEGHHCFPFEDKPGYTFVMTALANLSITSPASLRPETFSWAPPSCSHGLSENNIRPPKCGSGNSQYDFSVLQSLVHTEAPHNTITAFHSKRSPAVPS